MTKKKTLFVVIFAVTILFALLLLSIPKMTVEASAHDIPAEKYDPSEFSQLTYGIYWYQSGSDVPVAAKDATNYDPKKPTVIYAHGMKMNHEGLECREGLSLKDNNWSFMSSNGYEKYIYEEEFYQTLIDQGYNVGMFYWNQLADCMFTEECKFWVTTSKNGMSYTYVDENGKAVTTKGSDPSNPEVTVAALYRDCLVEALGEDFSGHLQLVGHSMGGQLTLAVSQALCVAHDRGDIAANFLPDRVTLLDPYLGSRRCSGTVDTTGEEVEDKPACLLAAEAAQNVAKHGIPIEAYGANIDMVYRYYASELSLVSGPLLTPEEYNPIIKLYSDNITWVYLDAITEIYGGFIPTHTMAVDYYFTTMYNDPKTDNGGVEIPSFKASDDQIRRLKGKAFSQQLDTSVDNPNPIYQKDCVYIRVDAFSQQPVEATPLKPALSGTVSENEKQLTVKIYDGDKEVATGVTLKGRFLIIDVDEGSYSVTIYSGNDVVGMTESVNVKAGAAISATTEEIEINYPHHYNAIDLNWTLFGIVFGSFILVIVVIAIISSKRHG